MLAAATATDLLTVLLFFALTAVVVLVAVAGAVLLYSKLVASPRLVVFDPTPPVPGSEAPAKEVTVREVMKHRADTNYSAQVAEELAQATTHPAVRKDKIVQFASRNQP